MWVFTYFESARERIRINDAGPPGEK